MIQKRTLTATCLLLLFFISSCTTFINTFSGKKEYYPEYLKEIQSLNMLSTISYRNIPIYIIGEGHQLEIFQTIKEKVINDAQRKNILFLREGIIFNSFGEKLYNITNKLQPSKKVRIIGLENEKSYSLGMVLMVYNLAHLLININKNLNYSPKDRSNTFTKMLLNDYLSKHIINYKGNILYLILMNDYIHSYLVDHKNDFPNIFNEYFFQVAKNIKNQTYNWQQSWPESDVFFEINKLTDIVIGKDNYHWLTFCEAFLKHHGIDPHNTLNKKKLDSPLITMSAEVWAENFMADEEIMNKATILLKSWKKEELDKISQLAKIDDFDKLDNSIKYKLFHLIYALIVLKISKEEKRISNSELNKIIIDQRNKDMVENAFDLIKDFSGNAIFIQVGNAHRKGITKMLQDKITQENDANIQISNL